MPLATPTLSITDLATSPTGATATIAGSNVAATNTVYSQTVNNSTGSNGTWTSRGSRTGDGNVSLTLDAGIYWFKCQSVLAGEMTLSNLILKAITNGLTAVHERCMQAVFAGLQTIAAAGGLGNLTAAQIFSQLQFDENNETLPCVCVCVPEGVPEQDLGGMNDRDDVGYPVNVIYIDRHPGDDVAARPQLLKVRERIARYFRNQRLSGVDDVYIGRWEPGPLFEMKTKAYQKIGSMMTLRFASREARG